MAINSVPSMKYRILGVDKGQPRVVPMPTQFKAIAEAKGMHTRGYQHLRIEMWHKGTRQFVPDDAANQKLAEQISEKPRAEVNEEALVALMHLQAAAKSLYDASKRGKADNEDVEAFASVCVQALHHLGFTPHNLTPLFYGDEETEEEGETVEVS